MAEAKEFVGCVTAQHVSDDNYEDDVDGLIQTIKKLRTLRDSLKTSLKSSLKR
jgi:hypothetical protein